MKLNIASFPLLFFVVFLFVSAGKSFAENVKSKGEKKSYKSVNSYSIPPRMIIVSPYFTFIYANDLYTNAVKDKSDFGGGLNVRMQIYKDFGFIIDGLYTNLKPVKATTAPAEQSDQNLVAIFTGGFYYSLFYYSLTDMRFDFCYGGIIAGNNVMTIFMPGIEFFRKISDRLKIFAKLGYPITNDWIVNSDYKEHYTSFTVSCGFSVVF